MQINHDIKTQLYYIKGNAIILYFPFELVQPIRRRLFQNYIPQSQVDDYLTNLYNERSKSDRKLMRLEPLE